MHLFISAANKLIVPLLEAERSTWYITATGIRTERSIRCNRHKGQGNGYRVCGKGRCPKAKNSSLSKTSPHLPLSLMDGLPLAVPAKDENATLTLAAL